MHFSLKRPKITGISLAIPGIIRTFATKRNYMRRCIIIQPNGLYAVYSSVVDTFTEWNLTKEQMNSRSLDYFGKIAPEQIEPNCDENSMYELPCGIVPVMKLADAIGHILANNETTASTQKMLQEMGYKYWDRVVLGSGDSPEDVMALLRRINIDIAKILYHYNVSLDVKEGRIVIKDEIFVNSEDCRFEPTLLEPDFESAKKENFYYTD